MLWLMPLAYGTHRGQGIRALPAQITSRQRRIQSSSGSSRGPPFLVAFPTSHFSVDYDLEADVLYISEVDRGLTSVAAFEADVVHLSEAP
jgi:hypothetical protein